MTRRLWIADRAADGRAYLTGDNALHLARVLRARKGQQFDIVAEGVLHVGTVLSISDDQVEFELGPAVEESSLPEVNAVISIYKFDRFEWAIEKLTELGVSRLLPVISRRTEPHLARAAEKRVERWRKIAHEAAQQSRRIAPPEIAPPTALAQALLQTTGSRIVLSELEEKVSLKAALAGCPAPLTLALGPEGGWTTEEAEGFRKAGWKAASLGSTILRAETAAIAAVAVVMAEISS
ncbi:MAG TPA: RsmE family RNA methyltransferase [Candidatus Saccharimonadales bacterium]|jgi:16S rRNA (uracil1498-N3)-methyltransferase|nr:RsmE family RNA methyltransferase [Candidatus Saccharimonadales bacterium]